MNENLFDISISIVTYKNQKEELLQTINSVFKSEGVNFKLMIVDNSPDELIKLMLKNYKKIEYIKNEKNIGFGAAHNISINKTINNSKYHLVLNPDTYFEKDTLKKIFNFMEKNLKYGLFMPKILLDSGELSMVRRLIPTLWDVYGKKIFNFLKYTKERESRYNTEFFSYDKPCSVPFVGGAFMFFRTSELKKYGLFDERFFMYFEDLDISRRYYNDSKTIYYPLITIFHVGHQDSHKNLKLFFIHILSSFKYFNKWGWCIDKNRDEINLKTISEMKFNTI